MNAIATHSSGAVAVVGAAAILTLKRQTTVFFKNDLIVDSLVQVCFDLSEDSKPPNSFSVCLFINDDMVASDHCVAWEEAMAAIFRVLSAKTAASCRSLVAPGGFITVPGEKQCPM